MYIIIHTSIYRLFSLSLSLYIVNNLVELKIDAPKLCNFLYAGVYLKYYSSNALALSQAIYNMTMNAPSFELSKQNLYVMFYSAKVYLVFIYLFISFDYLNLVPVLVIFSISPLISFSFSFFEGCDYSNKDMKSMNL